MIYTNVRKVGNIYEGRFTLRGRNYRTTSKSEKDCFNRLCLVRGIANFYGDADSNYTLGEWLNEWLTSYKAPNVTASTVKHYDIIIRLHLSKHLKAQPLGSITAIDYQKAIYSIQQSKTRLDTYAMLNASLRKALQLQLIATNPLDKVDRPKHQRQRGTALSPYELAKFLNDIKGHNLYHFYTFALYTGARRSEILKVTWNDIDLEKNIISIRGTKTEKSFRQIPIMQPLRQLLENMPQETMLLFPFHIEYVTKHFHKLVPTHKLHDLRHTFATRCLENGIPLKVVQEWLGHSTIKVTADVYSHVSNYYSNKQATLFKLL